MQLITCYLHGKPSNKISDYATRWKRGLLCMYVRASYCRAPELCKNATVSKNVSPLSPYLIMYYNIIRVFHLQSLAVVRRTIATVNFNLLFP